MQAEYVDYINPWFNRMQLVCSQFHSSNVVATALVSEDVWVICSRKYICIYIIVYIYIYTSKTSCQATRAIGRRIRPTPSRRTQWESHNKSKSRGGFEPVATMQNGGRAVGQPGRVYDIVYLYIGPIRVHIAHCPRSTIYKQDMTRLVTFYRQMFRCRRQCRHSNGGWPVLSVLVFGRWNVDGK